MSYPAPTSIPMRRHHRRRSIGNSDPTDTNTSTNANATAFPARHSQAPVPPSQSLYGDSADSIDEQLFQLTKLPENKVCCDCSQPQPTWVSLIRAPSDWQQQHDRQRKSSDVDNTTNSNEVAHLAALLCFQCSASHRKLLLSTTAPSRHQNSDDKEEAVATKVINIGAHRWTMEDVQALQLGGNAVLNRMYQAKNTHFSVRPHNASTMQERDKFCEQKYVLKSFYDFASQKKVMLKQQDKAAKTGNDIDSAASIQIHKLETARNDQSTTCFNYGADPFEAEFAAFGVSGAHHRRMMRRRSSMGTTENASNIDKMGLIDKGNFPSSSDDNSGTAMVEPKRRHRRNSLAPSQESDVNDQPRRIPPVQRHSARRSIERRSSTGNGRNHHQHQHQQHNQSEKSRPDPPAITRRLSMSAAETTQQTLRPSSHDEENTGEGKPEQPANDPFAVVSVSSKARHYLDHKMQHSSERRRARRRASLENKSTTTSTTNVPIETHDSLPPPPPPSPGEMPNITNVHRRSAAAISHGRRNGGRDGQRRMSMDDSTSTAASTGNSSTDDRQLRAYKQPLESISRDLLSTPSPCLSSRKSRGGSNMTMIITPRASRKTPNEETGGSSVITATESTSTSSTFANSSFITSSPLKAVPPPTEELTPAQATPGGTKTPIKRASSRNRNRTNSNSTNEELSSSKHRRKSKRLSSHRNKHGLHRNSISNSHSTSNEPSNSTDISESEDCEFYEDGGDLFAGESSQGKWRANNKPAAGSKNDATRRPVRSNSHGGQRRRHNSLSRQNSASSRNLSLLRRSDRSLGSAGSNSYHSQHSKSTNSAGGFASPLSSPSDQRQGRMVERRISNGSNHRRPRRAPSLGRQRSSSQLSTSSSHASRQRPRRTRHSSIDLSHHDGSSEKQQPQKRGSSRRRNSLLASRQLQSSTNSLEQHDDTHASPTSTSRRRSSMKAGNQLDDEMEFNQHQRRNLQQRHRGQHQKQKQKRRSNSDGVNANLESESYDITPATASQAGKARARHRQQKDHLDKDDRKRHTKPSRNPSDASSPQSRQMHDERIQHRRDQLAGDHHGRHAAAVIPNHHSADPEKETSRKKDLHGEQLGNIGILDHPAHSQRRARRRASMF